MDYATCRDDLIAKINTELAIDYPSLPVFYENTVKVDTNKVGNLFVRIELEFVTRENITVTGQPETEARGLLYFCVYSKEGSGTRPTLALFDYFTNLMKYQTVGDIVLETPRPGKKEERNGWISQELVCPFRFTTIPLA